MKRYIHTAVKILNSIKEAFAEANKANTQVTYFMMVNPGMWR